MAPLQLTADNHLASGINAVDLEYRLGDIETDCRDRLHVWLLQMVGALTAPTFMALTCRWRSRPQHQKRTLPNETNISPRRLADLAENLISRVEKRAAGGAQLLPFLQWEGF